MPTTALIVKFILPQINIVIIGPYEISFISKFICFFILIFLYSVLMVK